MIRGSSRRLAAVALPWLEEVASFDIIGINKQFAWTRACWVESF